MQTRPTPITGVTALLEGFSLISRPGLRRFVAVPLLINLLLFSAAIWWGYSELSLLGDWIERRLPDWLDWLSWLLWPLYMVSVILIGFYAFTLIANVIAAPFNSLLAERVEQLLDAGNEPATQGWGDLLLSIIPDTLTALKKLLRGLLLAIPFLILFLIPLLNLAAPVLWFLYGAWTLAASYLDYPMDNHRIPYREQRSLRRKRLFTSLTFGSAVMGATLIPLVNLIVMPAAVAGATLLWLRHYRPAQSS